MRIRKKTGHRQSQRSLLSGSGCPLVQCLLARCRPVEHGCFVGDPFVRASV